MLALKWGFLTAVIADTLLAMAFDSFTPPLSRARYWSQTLEEFALCI